MAHKKNAQFPAFVAAHRAEVRGPPVGRGPQVENRWAIVMYLKIIDVKNVDPKNKKTLKNAFFNKNNKKR